MPVSHALQHRSALSLAALTGVGMLASDLYLPALPSIQRDLLASLTATQATMAIFMFALAASQLAWGWVADRHGDARAIVAGTLMLAAGSLICALAEAMPPMLLGRLLQGLGAGAATVAVPALIRRRFSEKDSVGAMSLVATVESTIPALGPVIGAAIVLQWGWRVSFYLIALAAVVLLPVVSRIVRAGGQGPVHVPVPVAAGAARFAPGFLRHALSYAAMFAALLMFVASAPHLVSGWLGSAISGFALLQLFGVGGFMAGAALGARGARKAGVESMVRAGSALQLLAGLLMLACAAVDLRSLPLLIAAWVLFCGGLGLRGPSLMSRTLSLANGSAGVAAGLAMTLAFGATAAATMAVAPFLGLGLYPVAIALCLLVVASMALTPEMLGNPAATRPVTQPRAGSSPPPPDVS